MHWTKLIIMSISLLAISSGSAIAQQASALVADNQATNLSPEQRSALETRVSRWEALLEECHQGKRSESDRFFVLRGMLMDLGKLGQRKSAETQARLQEYRDILKQHPEFRTNPPQELSDARARRENEKAQESGLASASFTPSDSEPKVIYENQKNTAVLYQYRIDFFELPPDSTLKLKSAQGKNVAALQLFQGDKESLTSLKPTKTISFKHPFDNRPLLMGREGHVDNSFWICTSPILTYSPVTEQERQIVGAKFHDSVMPWVNEAGQYDDFCGAISLDGKILYQIPIKQEIPGTLLDLRGVTDDGSKALIYVGEQVPDSQDDDMRVGKFREILVWEAPTDLHRINPKNMSDDDVLATIKSYGFHGVYTLWGKHYNP